MPQIIFKERAAHLDSQTFFTRDADQYKNTSLSQLYQTPKTPISQNTLSLTNYFRPLNIAKFLRIAFLSNTPQMFFKIGVKVSQTSQERTCVGISF